MYISHVSLTDFRSYAQADVELGPGTNVLVGSNGVGKTNIVEAIGYLANLSSHRVSNDAPLLRFGTERALVRARIQRAKLVTTIEVEITAGKSNRARINRANPVRAREILGIVRTVLFAPEDLALVKGDPSNRRRFLDELLVVLRPGEAATRSDYERVLKQRNALLKSARAGGKLSKAHESTLDVWDTHLAQTGARLLRGRLDMLELLTPYMAAAYASLADANKVASAFYESTIISDFDEELPHETQESVADTNLVAPQALLEATQADLEEMFIAALLKKRAKELERGVTLVGPHRDDIALHLGTAPAKGYASHGETWSLCLALRLAAYKVFGQDDPRPGAGPILILDDVFAELDATRRSRLASIIAGAEQVIVTAAVASDVPKELGGTFLKVSPGQVHA